jgi:hypothetical protein
MPDTDPWVEAAKNFKPSGNGGAASAPAAGNDDWKVWQAQGNDSPAGGGDNFVQQRIDDAINTPSDSGPRWLDSFGRGAAQSMLSPIAHPVQAGKGLIKALQPDEGAAGAAEKLAGPAGPILAHTAKGLYDDYKQNGLPHALGNVAGGVIGGEATGGLLRGGLGAASDVAERAGGYTSPVIDQSLQNASKLAKSIRPPGGIPHGFEQELATNMPLVRAFAKEQGNPLHSQWEGAVAAKGLAQKGLEHFNAKFLEPNATRTVPIQDIPDYQGASSEGVTTIRDINKRLSDINDMTRPAGNAKTVGADMTAQQRLGLQAEASRLRQILYDKIAEGSGVAPEQIKGMREQYGQQFGIADRIDAARRARLGQIGAAEEGSSVPLDKTGILQKALTKVRGGQQYLADRNFRRAAGAFEPQQPVFPEPVAPDPAAIARNQQSAQQEFLHQNFLDQLAKDSAAQRSTSTTAYRQESKAAQGEALRAKGRRMAIARDGQ